MVLFSSRRKGITPSEMKGRAFSSGVTSKINRALRDSGNSRTHIQRKGGAILGVIKGAMASGPGSRGVAEPKEVKAGLQALTKNRVITQKDSDSVYKAIEKELYN